MCTVTYIAKGKDSFILTSNRDEAPARSPKSITSEKGNNGETLLFPRDTKAGGTWIAASSENKVVCLLNGAFEKHHHQPPYRLSRGLMVLHFFDFSSAPDFFHSYNFEGIEPFTMIIFDNGRLFEFRWDGEKKHPKEFDATGYYMWSSSTLYTKEVKKKREDFFTKWLSEEAEYSAENILAMHKEGGIGDPEQDFVMNRKNIVRTVSITQIVKTPDDVSMQYIDLAGNGIQPEFRSVRLLQPSENTISH